MTLVRQMVRRKAIFAPAFSIAAAAYCGASLFLARAFTDLRQSPSRSFDWTPADVGLAFEEVTFAAAEDALMISGWYVPGNSGKALAMIPGGGLNRLNTVRRRIDASSPPPRLLLTRDLAQSCHAILMYDPRGTGRSGASRASYGYFEQRDVVGALRFLERNGYDAGRVAILGSSMGGAAAMFALAHAKYGLLVADSALGGFSARDIAVYASCALRLPRFVANAVTAVMLKGTFTTARLLWGMDLSKQASDVLGEHAVPTLVIHGDRDRQVPAANADRIASAAGKALIGKHIRSCDHMEA